MLALSCYVGRYYSFEIVFEIRIYTNIVKLFVCLFVCLNALISGTTGFNCNILFMSIIFYAIVHLLTEAISTGYMLWLIERSFNEKCWENRKILMFLKIVFCVLYSSYTEIMYDENVLYQKFLKKVWNTTNVYLSKL